MNSLRKFTVDVTKLKLVRMELYFYWMYTCASYDCLLGVKYLLLY